MKKIIKILIYVIIAITFFTVVTFVIIHVKTQSYIWKDASEVPSTKVAMVLGASTLKDGTLSQVLKHRVDTAIELYKKEKVESILMTGDNSTEDYNEVNPVHIYLLDKGIPDKDIFLDHAGFDTYSSMYRARDIFLADSITVVTQSFHLPRSIFIARALGLNAYGMSSDKSEYKTRNYVREVFADVKAMLDLARGRTPKFLGETIPLTEEQSKTE